jgi:hypothetical protein
MWALDGGRRRAWTMWTDGDGVRSIPQSMTRTSETRTSMPREPKIGRPAEPPVQKLNCQYKNSAKTDARTKAARP